MKLASKKVSDSRLVTTHLVLPEHTNAMGNIFGGTIMSWMDVIASIVAYRHCRSAVVTASVQDLSFLHPVKLGELVTLSASINYTSKRSVEVGVKVMAENAISGEKRHTSSAYFTFVSLDKNGKAHAVPKIIPQTADERRRFREGERRREMRLQKK